MIHLITWDGMKWQSITEGFKVLGNPFKIYDFGNGSGSYICKCLFCFESRSEPERCPDCGGVNVRLNVNVNI